MVWQTNTKPWHRDTKWADAPGKKAPIDLLEAGLPETFNTTTTVSGTCNRVKHTKTRPAYMTMWCHFCNTVYVWERKKIGDKAAPHRMWTVLSKTLTLHPHLLISRPPRPAPPPALGNPVSVSRCAPVPTGHTLGPSCFLESFSKVIPSPQNPNQHSLSVLQMCPVIVAKKTNKLIYMIDIKIWMTRDNSFNLSEFSCF